MNLGERIKNFYEQRNRTFLLRKVPVILRIDGKAFHTFTKKYQKPFDLNLIRIFHDTSKYLLTQVQGAKLAYHQSDEISLLITDYDSPETESWFNYNVQKMTSVAASLATYKFNGELLDNDSPPALFDCRVFNIPKEEVVNYFIWRQRDWERNSISMYARSFFSHQELHKKNTSDIHEMLHKKGKNWADLDNFLKNGCFFMKENMEEFAEKLTYEYGTYYLRNYVQ